MHKLTDNQIQALIRLLADPDANVTAEVKRRLVEAGPSAVPLLEAAAKGIDLMIRKHARDILDLLQYQSVEAAFREYAWTADTALDLERGALLIAEYGYPDFDRDQVLNHLNRYAREVHPLMVGYEDLRDRIRQLNHYLFVQQGFHGNHLNYYDPDNSFLNRVIERRTGIPISLTVLYLLVAARLELPVRGVALPGHFIARCDFGTGVFWIDPFHGGQIMDERMCAELMQRFGHGYDPSHLAPVGVRHTIIRMLGNLKNVYAHQGREERAAQVDRLLQILLAGASSELTTGPGDRPTLL